MLEGCAGVDTINERLEDYYLEKSEIKDDENYKQYKSLEENNQLNSDGVYSEASALISNDGIEEERPGQVRVTFSRNEFLDIKYYLDAGMQNEVVDYCYMNPNDCLYASVSLSNSVRSNLYSFEGYQIYEYIDSEMKALDWSSSEENCIFQIPMTFSGTEISVVPVGKYEKRELTLNDYEITNDGNSSSLAGDWIVNDEETKENNIKINPITSYLVSYRYDNSEYFYVKSSPEARYTDNKEGIVIFDEANSQSTNSEYSVELHKYITVDIQGNEEWTYSINYNQSSEKASKKHSISGLKYNDRVIVESDKKIEWSYDEDRLSMKGDTVDKRYQYIFTVKENNASFYFDPHEYTYAHGSLRFKCRGQIITDGTYIGEGSQIDYEVETVDDGYWLPNGNHSVTVTNETETRAALNSIKFYEQKTITLTLAQPSCGGSIEYFVNGNKTSQNTIQVLAGSIVKMRFSRWEGWIRNYPDDTEYLVSEEPNQICMIDGKDVDSAFTEDEDHKPELIIVLDESLREDLNVVVSASGRSKTLKYQKAKFKNTYTLEAGKIGTENGVSVELSNDTVRPGEALKITVTYSKDKKNYSEETRYVLEMPRTELFEIYSKDEIASSTDYYKNVTVNLSRVNVSKYQEKSIDNGKIFLKYADTLRPIDNGSLADDKREVIVTITPNQGYYVSGSKHVSNDVYTDTMSFKKYLSDIEKIIKDHPIKKIYTVTLDGTDQFGSVVYTVNGTSVMGTVGVREGQKIKMSYTITNENYQIQRSWYEQLSSKTSETVTIEVSSDLDGKTIKRDQYITVVNK